MVKVPKGELTSTEIRKLIRGHNKLVNIKVPAGLDRDGLIKFLKSKRFEVDHKNKRLIDKSPARGKSVSLETAKAITKPKPKTALQKQKAEEAKASKAEMKKKETRAIKKEAIKQQELISMKKDKEKTLKDTSVKKGKGDMPKPKQPKETQKLKSQKEKMVKKFAVVPTKRTGKKDLSGVDKFLMPGNKGKDEYRSKEFVKKAYDELNVEVFFVGSDIGESDRKRQELIDAGRTPWNGSGKQELVPLKKPKTQLRKTKKPLEEGIYQKVGVKTRAVQETPKDIKVEKKEEPKEELVKFIKGEKYQISKKDKSYIEVIKTTPKFITFDYYENDKVKEKKVRTEIDISESNNMGSTPNEIIFYKKSVSALLNKIKK